MDILLKQFWPSLVALLTGGGFISYITFQQRRRDAMDRALQRQARFYELAFRRSDGYGRQITNLADPAADAAMVGNVDLAMTYLRLYFNFRSRDKPGGGREIAQWPDFLEAAKHELDQVGEIEEVKP